MPVDQISEFIRNLTVYAIPILFGITVHEVAHGWVAKRHGDRTAEMLGRLTLNPLKHIDPIGTIAVPLLTLWTGGFLFGWAKPVPINAANLRHPKRDMIPVALAGPGANLLMALGWALVYQLVGLLVEGRGSTSIFFLSMARIGVFFNILLMLFNLLPIPPLDGGRVLRGLVPDRIAHRLDALERYGLIIVIGLIVAGFLAPMIHLVRVIMAALGVPPV
jgi:Zn-dependent protease